MAGFSLIFHRDGGPIEPGHLERMQTAIAHRGPEGHDEVLRPGFALGHQHFRTTPEERGERQPICDPSGRLWVVFDGRLDNREELGCELGLAPREQASDAALILLAYQRWGSGLFTHLLGSFALAVIDGERRRVLLGRDPLGDCTLVYTLDARRLAAASEEQALLALPWVSSQPNEATLARFFAVEAAEPGATFFAEVRELPPAHALEVGADGAHLVRYWQPDLERRIIYRKDREYVEHLRELLRAAVECRLRSSSRPAVLMSGGLDSTSIAALAARHTSTTDRREPLLTLSWVFDQLPGADERGYIAAFAEACDVDSALIAGDDAWPLADLPSWPWNPNSPLEGLYRRLMQRAYAVARGRGAAVLLTGDGGDPLWTGGADWLRDLVRERRWLAAARGVVAACGPLPTGSRRPVSLRNAVGRALGWPAWGPRRRARLPLRWPWLTTHGRERLGQGDGPVQPLSRGARPEQVANLFDLRSANAVSLEAGNASRSGIEVRRPFRDRRLVEFFLALPAHQLYRPLWPKWALRQAMAGLLPEEVRLRRWGSTLLPLCTRGLVEREGQRVAALLAHPDALWRAYVRADWLAASFPDRLLAGRDGIESVVPWRCVCAELWQQGWSNRKRGNPWVGLQAS